MIWIPNGHVKIRENEIAGIRTLNEFSSYHILSEFISTHFKTL